MSSAKTQFACLSSPPVIVCGLDKDFKFCPVKVSRTKPPCLTVLHTLDLIILILLLTLQMTTMNRRKLLEIRHQTYA